MSMRSFVMAAVAAGASVASAAPTATFQIAIPEIGQEFFIDSGFIPGSSEFAGGRVIDARLDFMLEVVAAEPGDPFVSSAEYLRAEILVPVDLDPITPGAQVPVIEINGADEGWSGTGTFTISRQLDELIGGEWYVPLIFTTSVYPGAGAGQVVLGTTFPFVHSFVSITVEQVPAPTSAGVLAVAGVLATRRRRR